MEAKVPIQQREGCPPVGRGNGNREFKQSLRIFEGETIKRKIGVAVDHHRWQ